MLAIRIALCFVVAAFMTVSGAVDAQMLDQYSGYVNLPATGGASGFFRTEKFGSRWLFVTPSGSAFWMRGVFNVDGSGSVDDMGDSYDNRILRKYGSREVWSQQTSRRLSAWGFNVAAEYSHANLAQVPLTDRIPYSIMDRTSWYGLTNQGNYASGPFKDLIDSLSGSAYSGYTAGRLPDIYDPNYAAYSDGRLQAGVQDPFWGPLLTSPWHVGLAMDDTDDLFGFGPGPEVPAPVQHPHVGWIALCVAPTKATSQKHGVSYADQRVFTKYALRDFLQSKYGSIATLNSVWVSSYTSWGSDGGYGVGSGLLDENGRHSWLGSPEGTLAGAVPAAVADLDEFLSQYAERYFAIRSGSMRRFMPNHLVFGPATLNGWGGLSRKQILQAAGRYTDVLQAGVASQQVLDLMVQYAGERPIVTWEGWPANADSSLWRYPNPYGQGSLTSQVERGLRYEEKIPALVSMTSSGVQPIVGMKWWAWLDSWGEKTNWGLVSFHDNAYDGREAVTSVGTDTWGYPTGGEERDYGDFMTAVRTAHSAIDSALLSSPPPPPGGTSPPVTTITSPSTGTTVSGMVPVEALASGPSTVTRMELLLDGGIVYSSSGATARYSWDTSHTNNGNHRWLAKGYDSSGQVGLSSPVDLTVSNPAQDTQAPTVSVVQPVSGPVTRRSSVTLGATASDDTGVTRVDFSVNGTIVCSVATVPYSCAWKVPGAPGRSYNIQALAYDAAGHVGLSGIVTVTTAAR